MSMHYYVLYMKFHVYFSYTKGKDGHAIQHRVVAGNDVMKYAGYNSKDSVRYHMEEDVELDYSNNIVASSGAVRIHEIGDQVDPYWNDDLDSLDNSAYVPSMDGKSNYTLKRVRCYHNSKHVHRMTYLSRHEAVSDTLLVKRNKGIVIIVSVVMSGLFSC